jgi:hypothetical protein
MFEVDEAVHTCLEMKTTEWLGSLASRRLCAVLTAMLACKEKLSRSLKEGIQLEISFLGASLRALTNFSTVPLLPCTYDNNISLPWI